MRPTALGDGHGHGAKHAGPPFRRSCREPPEGAAATPAATLIQSNGTHGSTTPGDHIAGSAINLDKEGVNTESLEGEYCKTLADLSTKNLFMALKTAFKAEDITEVIARDVPEFFWGPQRSPPAASRASAATSTASSTRKDIAGERAAAGFTFGRKIF